MMEQMYQVKNFSSYDEYDKIKVQGWGLHFIAMYEMITFCLIKNW